MAPTTPPLFCRFVAAKLEAAGATPYSLLYVHTGCSYWANSPGVAWLRRAYAALPPACRERLKRCYVLHADWALRASAAALCPWLAADLWGKVEYVARAEFLPRELQVGSSSAGSCAQGCTHSLGGGWRWYVHCARGAPPCCWTPA